MKRTAASSCLVVVMAVCSRSRAEPIALGRAVAAGTERPGPAPVAPLATPPPDTTAPIPEAAAPPPEGNEPRLPATNEPSGRPRQGEWEGAASSRTPRALAPCTEPEAEELFVSSTGCSSVFGIRGSTSNTNGAPASDGSGLMVSSEGEEFSRRGVFSAHSMHRLAIGGGGAGFEGTLLGGFAGGFRIPVAERHGPVLRAGAFAYLRGNDAFFASLIDLPRIEAGYQYMRGRTALEVGMTAGAVLTGRFRAGETETRRLGSGFEVGAYGALHLPWVRLSVSGMRLPASDALSSPVRTAEGTLCAMMPPMAICADARWTEAYAIISPSSVPSEVRSVYAGLAFGFAR